MSRLAGMQQTVREARAIVEIVADRLQDDAQALALSGAATLLGFVDLMLDDAPSPGGALALPILLRGAASIGQHLGISPGAADHLHRTGALPTFRAGGAPYATTGALNEWQALSRAGKLPAR